MKSNKKFIVGVSALAITIVIAVIAIIGVLAAGQQTVTSAINVRYKVQNVAATVSARYYIGDTYSDFTTDKTPTGDKEIEFESSQVSDKSLHPQGDVIDMEAGQKLVFEYKFKNDSPSTQIMLSLITTDLDYENMSITYGFKDSSLAVSDKISVATANTITAGAAGSTVIEGDATKYAYVVMSVVNESDDASFSGSFTWKMDRYQEGMEIPEADLSEIVSSGNITGSSVTLAPADMANFEGSVLVIPSTVSNVPVTTIAKGAFEGNTELTSVTIPASVTSIGVSVFEGCWNLTSLEVDSNNPKYESINNCIIDKSTNTIVAGCNGSIIPSTVKAIGEGAFRGYSNPTIHLPEGLETIGNKVFTGDKTTVSGGEVAGPVSQLTSIVIPASVKTIGDYAFQYQADVISVTFAEGSQLTTVGQNAFSQLDKLQSIKIPASVTTLGPSVLSGCDKLTSVTFEDNSKLTTLPSYFVNNCVSLRNANFGNNSSLTTISKGSFASAGSTGTGLTVNFGTGSKLATITEEAFKGSGVANITLPSSLKRVEHDVFFNCDKLTTITFPENVTFIGFSQFTESDNLQSVYLSNVADWYKHIHSEAESTKVSVIFTEGQNIKDMFFDDQGTGLRYYNLIRLDPIAIAQAEFELYATIENGVLTAYNGTATEIYISDKVTEIINEVFGVENNITYVYIPASVVSLGDAGGNGLGHGIFNEIDVIEIEGDNDWTVTYSVLNETQDGIEGAEIILSEEQFIIYLQTYGSNLPGFTQSFSSATRNP